MSPHYLQAFERGPRFQIGGEKLLELSFILVVIALLALLAVSLPTHPPPPIEYQLPGDLLEANTMSDVTATNPKSDYVARQ